MLIDFQTMKYIYIYIYILYITIALVKVMLTCDIG